MTEAGDSDEALMARYARGEPAAFALLYRRHELRVWHYLERNVGNRALAEDLLQEVWFAVAREAPGYRPTARFTTWLFTIAHHRVIDAIRARREHLSLESMGYEASGTAAGPLAEAVAREQASALARALSELPPEQRDAFLLQMEGAFSIEEIAAVTG